MFRVVKTNEATGEAKVITTERFIQTAKATARKAEEKGYKVEILNDNGKVLDKTERENKVYTYGTTRVYHNGVIRL